MNKIKKNLGWFKMSTEIMGDERIAQLVEEEGMRGLGVYMAIIIEMHRRASRSLSRNTILRTKLQGATRRTIVRVLDGYGLFVTDGQGHFRSAISYLWFKNDDNQIATSLSTGLQFDDAPTPARINKTLDQETIDNDCRRYNAADKIKAIIKQMQSWNQWAEAVAMKSGFSQLLRCHWTEAVSWFENHITERDRQDNMTSLSEARRYFSDIINNPYSASALQRHLQSIDARQRTEATAAGTFAELPTVPSRRTANGWEPI